MGGGWLVATLSLALMTIMKADVGETINIDETALYEATTLECGTRSYTYRIHQPYTNDSGHLRQCYDDQVTVQTCWGRCDSSEVGVCKVAYTLKQSNSGILLIH